MKFSPRFLDEIRARASLEAVVGRRVRLVKRGREMLGLCPFHQEKTPSFTVSDQKGFFHCFGCGAHGDVIGFVMRSENLSFPEAVERLANEAGLEIPKETPAERARHEKAASLGAVVEAAAAWFEANLRAEAGRAARDYLAGRGLTPETLARFRLGFAPNARNGLKAALTGQGIDEPALVAAGLLIEPEGGGERYDRFRGRVMFPIRDARGRVVAFGGRILGPGEPKYLNSPETELFRKGAMLYGLDLAGPAARKANRIVVVEGYMDVIALHQAGLVETVAPLGTALTELQLELLWRYAPTPILCFDGDAAGERAASRVVERALPRLKAGFSLRFATLPAGEDPDSLTANEGRPGMEKVLDAAVPFSDALWRLAVGALPLETPEARAEAGRRLDRLIEPIPDRDLRFHYQRHFRQKLNEAAGPPRRQRAFAPRRAGRFEREPRPRQPDTERQALERERTVLQILLNYPKLLEEFGDEIALLDMAGPRNSALRDELVRLPSVMLVNKGVAQAELVRRGFEPQVNELTGAGANRRGWAGVDATESESESDVENARIHLRHALDLHHRLIELNAVLADAERAFRENLTEENMNRLVGVLHAIEEAPGLEDTVEGYRIPPARRRP